MHIDKRIQPIILALLAGTVAACVTLLIPIDVIENFTASSGLSEMIAQAAPPLGMTARLALAFAAAVLAAGIVLAIRGQQEPLRTDSKELITMQAHAATERRLPPAAVRPVDAADSQANMASGPSWFAKVKSRLDALAGRETEEAAPTTSVRATEDVPRLNRFDRHPDAPPRRPISASADFADMEDTFGTRAPAPAPTEADTPFTGTSADDPPEPAATDAPRAVPMAPKPAEADNWRPLSSPSPQAPSPQMDASDSVPPTRPESSDREQDRLAAQDHGDRAADQGMPYADLDLNALVDRLERRLLQNAKTAESDSARAESEPARVDSVMPAQTAQPPEPAAPSAARRSDGEASEPPSARPRMAAAPSENSAPQSDTPQTVRPAFAPAAGSKAPAPSNTPDRNGPSDDMDEALRAALETLERLSQRSA